MHSMETPRSIAAMAVKFYRELGPNHDLTSKAFQHLEAACSRDRDSSSTRLLREAGMPEAMFVFARELVKVGSFDKAERVIDAVIGQFGLIEANELEAKFGLRERIAAGRSSAHTEARFRDDVSLASSPA